MHSMSKDLEQMCSFTSFNTLVKDGKYQQVMYSSLLLLPRYSSHISGSLEMGKRFCVRAKKPWITLYVLKNS